MRQNIRFHRSQKIRRVPRRIECVQPTFRFEPFEFRRRPMPRDEFKSLTLPPLVELAPSAPTEDA
jgi:hypothetical protein